MADFSRLPGPNADLWDWQLLAACRGVDSSLFFHPEGERGAARSARENSAKEVCMRCPVRAECAAHALAVREPYGVWGGLTEDEREELMGRARNRVPATPHAGTGGPANGTGAPTGGGQVPGGPGAPPRGAAAPGAAAGAAFGVVHGDGPEMAAPGHATGRTARGGSGDGGCDGDDDGMERDPAGGLGADAEASWGEDAVPYN